VGVVTDRDLKRAGASDATTLEMHELFYLLNSVLTRSGVSRMPVFTSIF